MKGILYVCCLSLLLPLSVRAQQSYRDSLSGILTQKTTDSVKARVCFLLSDEWSYTDTLKAKQFLIQGKAFCHGNNYLLALYNFYNAQLLFETDKPLAEKTYLKADSILQPFKTPEAYYFRARAWHNYGTLRQLDNDSKTMLEVLIDKAIPLAIQSGNKTSLANNYAEVGLVFMNRWQYDKAEAYYNKALNMLKEAPQSTPNDVYIYLNAIRNLLYMDKLVDANKLIDKVRPMVTPGESEVIFLTNEGIYFKETKQYQNALNNFNKAIAMANEIKLPNLAEVALFQQYRTYTDMGKYEQAKNTLLSVINKPTYNYSQDKLTTYYELGETYARLGDMRSAYKWQKEYSTLLDSTGKSQLANDMNALEIKFRNAENQKKIVELDAANEKANFAIKSNHLISALLGSTSVFLLIVLVLGYFFYRNNKRSFAQQEQIKISQAMLEGQEAERNRVARDLHDGLGGMLAALKINLSEVAREKENNNKELQNIIQQLDGSVSELRRIAHNMMPEMLLKLGLEASLRDLCESLMSEKLDVNFQYLGINNLIRVQEQITIYRIVQELLANVVKHANAKHVLLQCSQGEGVFFITIEDDGKGFDHSKPGKQQGIGLSNIKSRVAYLNGKMEILSKGEQQGTSINIELHVTA